MAPLPSNTTARLYIEYTSVGIEHTLMLRLEASATSTDAQAIYASFVAAAKGVMDQQDSFTGARFSAAGSNVSFPITVTATAGTATVSEDPQQLANFVGISGRSIDGRDANVKLFTCYVNPDTAGYRVDSPSGAEATFRNWFNTNAAELVTISNSQVIWNQYLNYGYHAYWQRRARVIQ